MCRVEDERHSPECAGRAEWRSGCSSAAGVGAYDGHACAIVAAG